MDKLKIEMGLRLLETLTTALYEDPIVLFREYVQNSVDAYNSCIETDDTLKIDNFCINIEYNQNNIVILDNGYGIPENKFIEKMINIGYSDKASQTNQIGFRGIGRLSGMPFCKRLEFLNKPKGSNKIFVFHWDGNRFNELLNSKEMVEIESAISEIASADESIPYEGSLEDHFFKVILYDYNEEIREMLNRKDFHDSLSMLLPLDYMPQFTYKEEIQEKYKEIMGYDFEKHSFRINLNGKRLYKLYTNDNVLEAGLNFWPINLTVNNIQKPIGLLWFSFNIKMVNFKTLHKGISVRSKNMLMGNNYALADAITNRDVYVATYRELTQTLNSVYGEMLIYSDDLKDNARRDWFKVDLYSINLRYVIADFMKRLYHYRYTASKAFNKKTSKEELIGSYRELTEKQPETVSYSLFSIYNKENHEEENLYKYADNDIPTKSNSLKVFYEEIMVALHNYFENDINEFIKLRTYLKKYFDKEKNN